ncbi:FecR domain-containing protein [Achromobacter seleniivolatilans]|uniref:FecR domain-containing protein n=1 Tax=Achromobacter seleniivolatilans TaxID=3047478 RepID=A0ABY9LUG6_9BURK|nr:FecR domain-containing protein [Achromobacter sp. R39]WMD18192.1 FecR domain-containing protein [Achromobacter sp. R39]
MNAPIATDSDASEAALGWLVILRSGEATPQDKLEHQAWIEAHTSHAQAWNTLTAAVDRPISAVRSQRPSSSASGHAELLSQTLIRAEAAGRGRRQLLKGALSVAGLGSLMALTLAERSVPLTQLLADHVTGTAERRAVTLPDGSLLQLNARTAVDVVYSDGLRLVILREGELIVDVAPAAGGAAPRPPFVVRTAQGSIRALGTRIAVRQDAHSTRVAMLEHRVSLLPLDGRPAMLAEGQIANMTEQGVELLPISAQTAGAWEQGEVQLHDQPLGELINALRPYRKGYVRISPAAARQRVYGTYPLDDTDRTLNIVAETLPVRVRRYAGGLMVMIDTPADD